MLFTTCDMHVSQRTSYNEQNYSENNCPRYCNICDIQWCMKSCITFWWQQVLSKTGFPCSTPCMYFESNTHNTYKEKKLMYQKVQKLSWTGLKKFRINDIITLKGWELLCIYLMQAHSMKRKALSWLRHSKSRTYSHNTNYMQQQLHKVWHRTDTRYWLELLVNGVVFSNWTVS